MLSGLVIKAVFAGTNTMNWLPLRRLIMNLESLGTRSEVLAIIVATRADVVRVVGLHVVLT